MKNRKPMEQPGEKLYAGCVVNGNVWFNLGLSPDQSKLLTAFSKSFLKPGHRNNARAAWFLLNAALSHIEIVETLLRADLKGDKLGEMLWREKARTKLRQLN